MGWLHWLILVPYYIFAALSLFLGELLVARVLRLGVRANTLAMVAVGGGLLGVAVPLLAGWRGIADYGVVPMLGLVALSLLLALADAALEPFLPAAADRELAET